eukprot:COSAG01_NODE_28604_length_657_cov_1.007168_1_plen_37_part_01
MEYELNRRSTGFRIPIPVNPLAAVQGASPRGGEVSHT